MLTSLKEFWDNIENKWLAYVVVGIFVLGGLFVWWWPTHEAEKRRQELSTRIEELKSSVSNEADKLTLERDLFRMEKDLGVYESANRTAALQVIGGIFLILGAYLAYRNVRAKEESNVTERFSKAVEMLGSEQMDVRIGAIYALERIANDSLKDHWTVMEVLTAFVRENSKKREEKRQNEIIEEIDILDNESLSPEDYKKELKHLKESIESPPDIEVDFQIALTVIIRRKWWDKEMHGDVFNFRWSVLPKADLAGAHLEGINFTCSKLAMSYFNDSNLSESDFSMTDLEFALFYRAKLNKSDFSLANLKYAFFNDADLRGADLTNSDLYGTNFERADLRGAILWEGPTGGASNLNAKQLESAIIDKTTILPPEFKYLQEGKKEIAKPETTNSDVTLKEVSPPDPKPKKPQKPKKNSNLK